ncbi:resistin-like isoform X1 [Zootoca vivipara]|uniref:resistin-like isoform X1 n=2 Tax=Zootoca vivipara TaxID=8524 RepID=UPI00293B9721|nr:resistin-like isoform X1 [Zootoca vivipara]
MKEMMKLAYKALPKHKIICTSMMKFAIFLFFVVLIPAKYASAQTCVIESLINERVQAAVDSKVSSILAKVQLTCTGTSAPGADAICPSGYLATGCACGMACGSWDIRGDNACHCQCARIDWTAARCCKVAIVG